MFRFSPMRRGALLAAAAAVAVATSAAHAQAKLPAPSGQITYRMNSSSFNGTTTLSWIENGKKARNDIKATAAAPGQAMSMDGWTITDGTHVYIHNPVMGKQAMRMKLETNDPSALIGFGAGGKAGSGKVVGKATILGKPCEVRQMEGAKVWLWQGMPLKIEAAANGPGQGMTIQAVKIDTQAKPAASLFKVPAGFQVVDAPAGFGAPGAPGARK